MITIEMLQAVGVSDQQIIEILKLEQSERSLRRREQNRKAKQKQRSRQQFSADRADRADTYTRVSESYFPSESTKKKILGRGISNEEFERGLDRFRNHYQATGASFVDPDAKLINWFSNPIQSKGQVNGHPQPPERFSREWRRERTAAAFSALANFQAGGDDFDPGAAGWIPEPQGGA